MILILHILFCGIWVGCILTEALFERALLGSGRENHKLLSDLHKEVDLLIEIPAFIGVIFTGIYLLLSSPISALLIAKIMFGAIAVFANIYCVKLVLDRVRFAAASEWDRFDSADHMQHKIGAVVLVGVLTAASIGIYLASIA
jgi:small-conductance mechanosensitive channel